ncbi:polyamine deacetylase HDAC10 isoform X3 [Nannospalax galili]|uniref:polyamine deacetylase HDAC10 isoform X3 n=1 Tax=Nannospalax galili TaxID=1026970 RepID=UPI00111C0F2F|nr:polyamine deacetylase HDAC10 isoform X3 [Nannospalax galili]
MGTALVYHEDMTATRLLWDDPECEIECPERLVAALDGLRQQGLEQRCLRLSAYKASEEELGLVHSQEYVALVRKTQTLDQGELQALSKQFDAVYFHPSTFHCARLAVGAALQLVDAVLTGTVQNGLALVRPPGHHSQRAAANGFCVFNNVAIAAKHAKQKYGLNRILIVDWDVHHGQGTQYIFSDDPSVLYFSWHRYEHGCFWPFLQESDADAVGQGQGRGFTVNLPWNQVGMGNADYLAAFLNVLLPLAFEFDPELVLVSAGFDSAIGDPEGGYHLESLAQSVCMMVQTLLGDSTPPLLGPMMPCQRFEDWSWGWGVEVEGRFPALLLPTVPWSPSSVSGQPRPLTGQASNKVSLNLGWWVNFGLLFGGCHSELLLDVAPVLSPSTYSSEGRSLPLLSEDPTNEVAGDRLSPFLDRLALCPTPPVHTAVALTVPAATLALPPGVLHQEGSPLREETKAWVRPHESLFQDKALAALEKILYLLDGILDGQVNSGLAAMPALAAAATLGVIIQRCLSLGAQRLFCVALGQLDRPLDLADDGRILWLNITGEEAATQSMFHITTPLPGTTGGFLSCILGLVLPLAYGFQPDMVLVSLGPAHGLQDPHAALLTAMLRGPAGGRILALVEEDSIPHLVRTLARVLHGEAPPNLGPFLMASPKDIQALMYLKGKLEPQWKLLQVAAPLPGPCSLVA